LLFRTANKHKFSLIKKYFTKKICLYPKNQFFKYKKHKLKSSSLKKTLLLQTLRYFVQLAMKRFLYFLYQWLVFTPIVLVLTVLTSLIVIIFSLIFGNKYFGYYPPKYWGKLLCWLALSPVKVRGKGLTNPNQSYVFVANHQGYFDILMSYGFLNQNIKWVQKQSLRNVPIMGKASEIAGHVFVDNSSPRKRIETIKKAEKQIVDGVSIFIFPEGSRTWDGKMGRFKRGAYQIAIDLKLPIVPITLNGPFEVLPRFTWMMKPHKMEMVIHEPISTDNLTEADIPQLMNKTKEIIYNDLWEKYK